MLVNCPETSACNSTIYHSLCYNGIKNILTRIKFLNLYLELKLDLVISLCTHMFVIFEV